MAVHNDPWDYNPYENAQTSQSCPGKPSPIRCSTNESEIPGSVRKKLKPRSKSVNSSVLLDFCRNTRVLYIEDSPSFHLSVKAACERTLGWDLTICATGQEGVETAKAHSFDIILMDIRLGSESEFDGYEAARKIKELKPGAIIVSFSSDKLEEKQIKGAHMDGHIDKNGASGYLLKALSPFIEQARVDMSLCFFEDEEMHE